MRMWVSENISLVSSTVAVRNATINGNIFSHASSLARSLPKMVLFSHGPSDAAPSPNMLPLFSVLLSKDWEREIYTLLHFI